VSLEISKKNNSDRGGFMEFKSKSEKQYDNELVQYKQVIQTMLDGFILADTEGQILSVNSSYCTMMGYSEAELLQKNIRELEVKIPPEEIERRIEKMVKQGADRFETQHQHKDGHVIDLDVSITIMQAEVNPLVAAFVQDITERKRTMEALRESEEQYRVLYEAVPVGVGIADQNGNFLNFNDILLVPGGYTREDILEIGQVGKLYADSSQREQVLGILKEQGFVNKHEVEFKRKDGTTYYAALSLTPIQIKNEMCVQAVVEDISERKQVEETLKRWNEELEEEVEKRVQEMKIILDATIDREVRMAELKKVVKQLRNQLIENGVTPIADDPLVSQVDES
jgi:PAS domain S-box-containing protein